MSLPVRLLAPAKINLHLRVGKRRADGFHPLLTWMCTVGLFDILTLEATGPTATARAAGTPRDPVALPPSSPRATGRAGEPARAFFPGLRFDCDQPGLPRDEGNLVVRIAKAFAAEISAGGARGSMARDEGGGGAAESAGAAPEGALGICGADRNRGRHESPPGTGRGAGAARDADWRVDEPVGKEDAEASLPDNGNSRNRTTEALEAPAAHGPVPGAESGRIRLGGPARVPPTGITLAKRIPVGAGLGGGSSDAAAALLGLDRLWNAGWTADRLSGFSARFGSDVPFFVAAGAAAGSTGHAGSGAPSAACFGRGEIVRPVPRPVPRWALLALPPFPLSTRDVYGRFDEMGLGSDGDIPEHADADASGPKVPDWRAWSALGAEELLARLVNDLEAAAFSLSPDLAALRAAAERTVGRTVRMSGSGSSLFTLFDADEIDAAGAAADAVSRRHGIRVELAEMCPAVTGESSV